MKKGQTAMEYLMTYGWAILIILVVGGVLYYYGVFTPGRLVGESKVGFTKVDVPRWSMDGSGATDTLTLMMENRAGGEINVTDITVEGTANPQSIVIPPGERSNFITANSGTSLSSGDAYQADATITYEFTDTPGTSFVSSGTLTGTAS